MKRISSILTILAVSATAATAQNVMTLEGELPGDYNGKKVVLVDLDTRSHLDSTTVKAGKLKFTTKVTTATPAALTIDGHRVLNFILEPGTAAINGETGQVRGTALNDLNESYGTKLDSIHEAYKKTQKEKMKSAKDEEEMKKIAAEIYEQEAEAYGDILLSAYKDNKTNAVGYMWFLQVANGMSVSEIDELLDGAADWIKNSKAVASYKKVAMSLESTSAGKMFTDFSVKTSSGKTEKLSDYVGKGDYVIADFFASWCGPCRREMPTLKGIYEKYNGKGLKVVGVAVWDEPADTKKCVEELKLPWTIIDNAQSGPTDIYGISGIPTIIVFAPDGTIVTRELRGAELAAKIDELLAK